MLQVMKNFLCQIHSKTSEEICQFLIANKLIKDSMRCNYCQQQMDLKRCDGNQEKYNRCCMNLMLPISKQ